MTKKTLLTVAAILAALCLFPTIAQADEVDSRRHALEVCVRQHIPVERAKPDPRVRQILKACDVEARAFKAVLPPGAAEQIWQHVEHVLRHKLAE